MIRPITYLLAFGLWALAGAGVAEAQLSWLVLGGPPHVDMEVRASEPTMDLQPDEHDRTRLFWVLPGAASKVTVSTACPGQSFTLKVWAEDVRNGASTGPIVLTDGMPPVDFVVDIPPKKVGGAVVHYRAEATVEQGNSADEGVDAHTITYTLTEQ